MKIIKLPYHYAGHQLTLAWYGYSIVTENHPVRIFALNQAYLSISIIDWDIISMMNTICGDFPEYKAIEQAAVAEGPAVVLTEAKLNTNKIRVDQIPFILESIFFKGRYIKARQYVNAGEDSLGYRVVFRFANPLQKAKQRMEINRIGPCNVAFNDFLEH